MTDSGWSSGRFVLYGGITCPFTHRTLLARVLGGLEDAVPLVLTRPIPGPDGWTFDPPGGTFVDPLLGAQGLIDLYRAGDPDFSGPASVPMLWDRERHRVACNESRDIVMRFAASPHWRGPDVYPEPEREQIDEEIRVFEQVFVREIIRAGSVADQAEYDQAVRRVFDWLDHLERHLTDRRYLGGAAPNLADLVFFPGLIRFDTCYFLGSRCHLRRIQDYPALWGYLRDLYQLPGVAATVDLDACRTSYFTSGPGGRDGVIPVGPEIDLSAPHDRQRLSA